MTEATHRDNILIVDDEKLNIDILKAFLEKDYNLFIAKNGQKALQRLEANVIDLILLDIVMPEMNGYEVCKTIQSNEETREIPVVFLTSRSEPEDVIQGFEVGGVDYVTKPFNSVELKARVATHLKLRKSQEKVQKQNARVRELLHILCHDLANPIGTSRAFLELIEEDPADSEELLGLCIKATDHALDVIDLVRQIRALDEKGKFLDLQPIKLRSAVEKAFDLVKPKFDNKNIMFKADIDASIQVMAEEVSLINSVIDNLFTNSIKFSYEGDHIDVEASVIGDQVQLEIRDYGIGMSETTINNLFDLSQKTSRDGTQGESGTGFGMPLVRKFMVAYGGEITVNSIAKTKTSHDHGTSILLTFQKA